MSRPYGSGGRAAELRPADIEAALKIMAKNPKAKRDMAIFYLGLCGGLRIGEICSLKLGDVTHGGQIFREIRLDKHKTKSAKTRTVALASPADGALQAYLQTLPPDPSPNGPLFPGRDPGQALTSGQAIRMLDEVFEKANLMHASSHSLRRTHANMLRRAGADLKVIQDQLGHSSLSTTQAYLSVDPEEKRRAVANLRF